jgi:hypothetical protein
MAKKTKISNEGLAGSRDLAIFYIFILFFFTFSLSHFPPPFTCFVSQLLHVHSHTSQFTHISKITQHSGMAAMKQMHSHASVLTFLLNEGLGAFSLFVHYYYLITSYTHMDARTPPNEIANTLAHIYKHI